MRPPGSYMGFIGQLVGAEARVAIDAEQALLRGPHKAGRKVHHRVSHLADDGEHGFFELGFVYGLARCEPCAVVVAGQVAEEGDTLRAKMGGRRSRNGFRSASHAAGRLANIAERGGAIGCGKRRSFPSARSFPPIAHPLQPGGPLSHGVCECSGQRRLDRTRVPPRPTSSVKAVETLGNRCVDHGSDIVDIDSQTKSTGRDDYVTVLRRCSRTSEGVHRGLTVVRLCSSRDSSNSLEAGITEPSGHDLSRHPGIILNERNVDQQRSRKMPDRFDQRKSLPLVVFCLACPIAWLRTSCLSANGCESFLREERLKHLQSVVVQRSGQQDSRERRLGDRCFRLEVPAEACKGLGVWTERTSPTRNDVRLINHEVPQTS